MKIRVLGWADTVCHKMFDWYINATPFGHHLPGWGRIQLWQWYLCNVYERAVDEVGDW